MYMYILYTRVYLYFSQVNHFHALFSTDTDPYFFYSLYYTWYTVFIVEATPLLASSQP